MKQILLISVLLIILFSSSYSHNYSKDIQINNDDPVNADKIGQLLMDTVSAKYLPLAVGNIYIYRSDYSNPDNFIKNEDNNYKRYSNFG
jgi:hypothetical protein